MIFPIICSYIAEICAKYFFTEFDVEVQTAEVWQLNLVTVKLALCPGTKLSSFLDLMP